MLIQRTNCTSSLSHPLRSLLAGRTDDLILQAYARHHQAIRQVPGRGWELHLVPVHIKNGPTQATHRVIMVLRCPIDAQAVTWTAHTVGWVWSCSSAARITIRGPVALSPARCSCAILWDMSPTPLNRNDSEFGIRA